MRELSDTVHGDQLFVVLGYLDSLVPPTKTILKTEALVILDFNVKDSPAYL